MVIRGIHCPIILVDGPQPFPPAVELHLSHSWESNVKASLPGKSLFIVANMYSTSCLGNKQGIHIGVKLLYDFSMQKNWIWLFKLLVKSLFIVANMYSFFDFSMQLALFEMHLNQLDLTKDFLIKLVGSSSLSSFIYKRIMRKETSIAAGQKHAKVMRQGAQERYMFGLWTKPLSRLLLREPICQY